MVRRPPRSTRTDTLCPYTTLFRSGRSEEAFRLFGRGAGTPVAIEHPRPVDSLEMVRAKIQGRALDAGEYAAVVRDIAALRYSKMELAAFLVACAGFMTTHELLPLPRATAGEIGRAPCRAIVGPYRNT